MDIPSNSSIKIDGDVDKEQFIGDIHIKTEEKSPNSVGSISLPKPKGWGQRHTLAILGFWGFSMAYALRFNLAIGIVAMAKSPPSSAETGVSEDSQCEKHPELPKLKAVAFSEGEFDWNPEHQGMILGAFFWGYFITQLPGGFLATRFGGKWPLGVGLLLSGFFALMTPLAARTNIAMLMYVRIVQGLGQGMIFPSMQRIFAAWSPPEERSRLSAITYSGCQFGAAMTMISSGYLIEGRWGWPSVFYATGITTLIWFACWSYFVYNSPADHPRISPQERDYIQASLGGQCSSEMVPTPWKKILTSKPVWAIVLSGVGHSWGFYTLLTEMPTYLKTVLHFDIKQDSWFSAMPALFMWGFSNLITYIADYCIAKKYARVITVRKICHAIADLTSALALIGVCFITCNRAAAVALLTIAVTFSGGVNASYFPNQVEVACNHVGIIMGISNTMGNFAGFGTAVVAGAITKNNSSREGWSYVFLIAIVFYILGVIFFTIFASSEEQPWNRNPSPTDKKSLERSRSKVTEGR